MEKWQKPDEKIIALYHKIVDQLDGVEQRSMFGCPCSFVKGNMFFGVFQDQLFLRMGEDQREELEKSTRFKSFSPMGKIMKAYIAIPGEIVSEQEKLLALVNNALTVALLLPQKIKKG